MHSRIGWVVRGSALVSRELGRFGYTFPMFLEIQICVHPYLHKDSARNVLDRKAFVTFFCAVVVIIHAVVVALVDDEGYFLQLESRGRIYMNIIAGE